MNKTEQYLEDLFGTKSNAASKLGVARRTIYNWIEADRISESGLYRIGRVTHEAGADSRRRRRKGRRVD